MNTCVFRSIPKLRTFPQLFSSCQLICRALSVTLSRMSKKALVVIAQGSEEIEAVTSIDVLRRAGVEVSVAGLLDDKPVTCSRNVVLVPEGSLKEFTDKGPFDAIILPGGLKGAEAFCNSAELGSLLKEQEKAGRLIASICAGPTALKQHGIGFGKSVTSYPGMSDRMKEGNHYVYKEDRVVVDGDLITSRGPGTSIEFAVAIAEYLVGKEKAAEVGKGLLML